jgi:hypothetical protein
MPLILVQPNDDRTKNLLIVLGPDNVERMKEKDPVEIYWDQLPFSLDLIKTIGISYATDAELVQMEQLARQGKTNEAVKMAISGWKYRPEKGDHDLGYQKL